MFQAPLCCLQCLRRRSSLLFPSVVLRLMAAGALPPPPAFMSLFISASVPRARNLIFSAQRRPPPLSWRWVGVSRWLPLCDCSLTYSPPSTGAVRCLDPILAQLVSYHRARFRRQTHEHKVHTSKFLFLMLPLRFSTNQPRWLMGARRIWEG